jgi:hypothetical protein
VLPVSSRDVVSMLLNVHNSLFLPCRGVSCDVALPEHIAQDLEREVFFWINDGSDQRCFKWIGRGERCELNGEPVHLDKEGEINAGDDLEV